MTGRMIANAPRWAAGTFMIAALLALASNQSARAQTKDFNVPGQSATTGIPEFARQAGIQILVSETLVRGKLTNAVTGSHDVASALSILLKDTGLVATSKDGATYTLATVPQPKSSNVAATSLNPLVSKIDQSISVPKASLPDTTEKKDTGLDEIIVTGSHIRGSQPIAPVHTLTRLDIDESGYSQIGDVVRSLPENFSGGQNPGLQNTGTAGSGGNNLTNASTVNLRGLGPDATLVLLNGHRLAADGIFQAADISGIPLAAIERVEVVTDGASALYGSDAVAGVVNFILRKNLNGVEAGATAGGATQGGGFEQDYNVLVGRTWSTGHALAGFEYFDQDPIMASQRSFTSTVPLVNALIWGQDRKSTFVNADQELGDWGSFHIDGLYSERRQSYAQQATLDSTTYVYATPTWSYLLAPGVTFELPRDWTASIEGSASKSYDVESASLGEGIGSIYLDYKNSTRSVEANTSGPLLALPSGALKLAVGVGHRNESFDYSVFYGGSAISYPASRDVNFAYGELSAPLITPSSERRGLEKLDLSLAARVEKYSDFASTSNPKVGIRYVPLDEITIRGTWGKSFKAPTLYQIASGHSLQYYPASVLGSTATGNALIDYGGNPELKPERSTSWTAGIDWSAPNIRSLDASVTYFNIDYTDRIVYPINVFGAALSDPIYAPFITRNPTPSQQAAAIASVGPEFYNYTGAAYDPAQTIALIEDRYTNASAQKIDGIDLSVKKSFLLSQGDIHVFLNATRLHLTQQTIFSAPSTTLTGIIFNPPKTRIRSGVTWAHNGITLTGIVNYVSSEIDTVAIPNAEVASWTTLDLNLAYHFPQHDGMLSGLETSLSVTNALDRDPPYAKGGSTGTPGIYFDSTNASPIGRFIALTIRKRI
jgi:iron complex outermembrane recepter protein